MKNLLLIFSFTITLLAFGNPQLDSAKVAYDNGNFREAINLYEEIANQDLISSDLFFNLGNAYYRSNELGKSILNFEKSLLLKSSNEDALYNLEVAKSKTVDKFESIPQINFSKTLRAMDGVISNKLLAYVGILILIIAVTLLALKKNKKLSLLILIIGIIINIWAIQQKKAKVNFLEAVVLSYKSSVKSEPNLSGSDLFELHEGTKVIVESQLDGWIELKTSNGEIGWIPQENLGLIQF